MNSNPKRKMELVSSSSDMVSLDSEGHCSSYESSVINSRLSHYNSTIRDRKPNLTGSIWDMDDDLPSNYPAVKVSLKLKDEDVYIVTSDDEIEVLEPPEKSRMKTEDGSRKRQRTSSLCDANQNNYEMRGCHESENQHVKIVEEVPSVNPCLIKDNDILSVVEVIATDSPVDLFMTHQSNIDSLIKQSFQTVNNDKPIITSAYSLGKMYGSQMKLSSTAVRMIPPDRDTSQSVLENVKTVSTVVLDEAAASSRQSCVEILDTDDLIPVRNTVTEGDAEVQLKPDLAVECADSEEDSPEILGSFIPAKNLNDSSKSKPVPVKEKTDKVNTIIHEHGKLVFAEKRKGTIDNQTGGKRKEKFEEWAKARMSSSTKPSNAVNPKPSKVPSPKLTSHSAQKSPFEEVRERAGLISAELSKHIKSQTSQPEIILLDVEEKRPEVIHIEEESAKRQKTPDIIEIQTTQRPRNQRQQTRTYPVDWRTRSIGKRTHTASSNYNAEYERRHQTNVEKEWMDDLGVRGTPTRQIQGIETPLCSPLSLAHWHSSSASRDSTPARQMDVPRQPNSSPRYSQHQPKMQTVPRQPRTSSRYINNPYMPRNGKSSVKVVVTVFNSEPENLRKLTLSLRDFEELRKTFEVIERLVPGVNCGDNRVHYSAKAVVCLLRFACNITFTLPSWEVAVEVYALAHYYHLNQLCTDCIYYFNHHPIDLDEVLEVSKLALYYKIHKFLGKFRNFSRGFNHLGLGWDKVDKYHTPHCYISSDTYVECIFNVPLMESAMIGLDRARTDDIRNDLEFLIQFGAVKITSLQLKLDVPSTCMSSTHISVHVSKDNQRVANMELNRKLASIMKIDFDKDVMAKAGSRLTVTIMLEELPFKFCSVLCEERLSTRQLAVTMSSSKKDQDGNYLFFVENVSFNE